MTAPRLRLNQYFGRLHCNNLQDTMVIGSTSEVGSNFQVKVVHDRYMVL